MIFQSSNKILKSLLLLVCICNSLSTNLILETTQMLITPNQKLNFNLSNIRSLESATYTFKSDIENLKTNQFQNVSLTDLKTQYKLDVDIDPTKIDSFQSSDGSYFMTFENNLYVFYVEKHQYIKRPDCSVIHVANDFIFCIDLTKIEEPASAKIDISIYMNTSDIEKNSSYSVDLKGKTIESVKAFDYFKNEDDGMVLTILVDNPQKILKGDKDFQLIYLAFERNMVKLKLELEYPENNLISSNYINNQIMFVSQKYLTTLRLKNDEKDIKMSYVYSFYEDLLTNCNFDNSDSTNMILSCATQTLGKILKFSFLKSNFLINTMITSKILADSQADYLKTVIMYKYIYVLYKTKIQVFSTNNYEFHAISKEEIPDLTGLLTTSDPIMNTISYIGKGDQLVVMQVFSYLQALCVNYTKGTYMELDFEDTVSGMKKTVRFELEQVPADKEFYQIYEQKTLSDISFNGKNLNYKLISDLALGSDLNKILVVDGGDPISYKKINTNYKFVFNTNFNAALSEFTKFLYHESNGVPLLILVSQTNAKLSLFQCRISQTIRCRLSKEVILKKGELLQYANFRSTALSSDSVLVFVSDQRIGIGQMDDLDSMKWKDFEMNLGLRNCTSPDQANIFCICEHDNFIRKIMVSNNLEVSIFSIPEIELAKLLISSSMFTDLVFVQTINGLTIFNFKLKKIKYIITNEVTVNDTDFFIKISELYLVFISKKLNCFIFYELEEFRQGNSPIQKFSTCLSFPTGYKLSNYTVNSTFFDSKMPLILHDSSTNYLLMYDLSRPFMDLLFFVNPIAPRNKLEIINYQIHRSFSENDFYYVTISNPSYSVNPLACFEINFSKSIQTNLSLNQKSFPCVLKVVSGLNPDNHAEFTFTLNREMDTVSISAYKQQIDKFGEDRMSLSYSNLYSVNSLAFNLQVDPDLTINDFINKFTVTSSLVYNHSFLQSLNMRDFDLKSQVYLSERSLLIILTRDSLLYFRYKNNKFFLLNIVSLRDFFSFQNLQCLFISADSASDLHVLCDDSERFSIIKFSLSNIFLPVTTSHLFNSSKNWVTTMIGLVKDKMVIFNNDSGSNQSKYQTETTETRSFYTVYDCIQNIISSKMDLQQSYSDLLGVHSVGEQLFFFFRQKSFFLPLTDKILVNQGINLYTFDLQSLRLSFEKTITLQHGVDTLKHIMMTPTEEYFVLIYNSNQIETVITHDFVSEKFTVKKIPNYDNFQIQNCFFEEPFTEYTLTCFMLQGDDSSKENEINSLILTFNLFPMNKEVVPTDFFEEFYPMRISKEVGLQDIDMLLINHTGFKNRKEKFLILRIGTSIYDIFNFDERELLIKNDMVKNTLGLSACSPYNNIPNQLIIIPKYNIKTLILFFSIGFASVMLILFLCHFKFMKDAILNKYKKFKIEDAETLLDVDQEDAEKEQKNKKKLSVDDNLGENQEMRKEEQEITEDQKAVSVEELN